MGDVDRWLVLTAHVAADDPSRDDVVEALVGLGGLSVLEEREGLTTYLVAPSGDADAFLDQIRHKLAERLGAEHVPALSWRSQANEDWEREWRRGLQPRKVSPRFVVKPSWTEWRAAPGEIVIDIDPQMAFGTGEHATTRGCLRLLDDLLRPGDRVLDVGSGSAILSIAAARAGAGEVIAVEFDADANLNARENLLRNGAEGSVRLIEQRADDAMLRGLGQFDMVLANLLSGILLPLLPSLREVLTPSGTLIVSGILEAESQQFREAARRAGLRLSRELVEEEWWTASLNRANP